MLQAVDLQAACGGRRVPASRARALGRQPAIQSRRRVQPVDIQVASRGRDVPARLCTGLMSKVPAAKESNGGVSSRPGEGGCASINQCAQGSLSLEAVGRGYALVKISAFVFGGLRVSPGGHQCVQLGAASAARRPCAASGRARPSCACPQVRPDPLYSFARRAAAPGGPAGKFPGRA